MSKTIVLTKPITAHSEPVNEITLRDPTTADVVEIGLPTLIVIGDGGGAAIEIRQKLVAKYVSKLAAIPLSSVFELSMRDYSEASAHVLGFFNQGDA